MATETIAKDFSAVLRKPRITEKAALMAEQGIYTFNVDPRTTKTEVAEAIEKIYKVTPTKVRMVTIPKKPVKSKKIRKTYSKGGGKKAYVHLKKGDSISFA